MTTISCCGYTKVRDWGFLQEKRSLEAEFDEKDLTKAPEQVQELDLKIDCQILFVKFNHSTEILEVKISQDVPMSRIANVAI